MRRGLLAVAALLVFLAPAPRGGADGAVVFAAWSPDTFARAKRERRILVVTVTTTWCHWCHVMQRETYGNPTVRAVLERSFLPVRVDGDERPDLSERFREYRWPATAFLTPDAQPVLALRGYRSPEQFRTILADVQSRVARGGPYPGFDAPVSRAVVAAPDRKGLEALSERLRRVFDERFDEARAGWGGPQKYPIPEPIEWGFLLGRLGRGSRGQAEARALRTLVAETALLDPVWGGMYQYSVGGSWASPHFEKIMSVNAGALDNFADAFLLTRDPRWLRGGREIIRWLRGFLRTADGPFFASQDAEPPGGLAGEAFFALSDSGRRAVGVPRVDRHVFARENGLAVQALCRFYAATGDEGVRSEAVRAAERVLRTHAFEGALLLHDAAKPGVLYLADQSEMGRALLALHRESGDERWLRDATILADGCLAALRDDARGGFFDHTKDPVEAGIFADRLRSLEPNASMARFLLELSALTDRGEFRSSASSAIATAADPGAIDRVGRYAGGLLLAVEEALLDVVRVEVAGTREDPTAKALFVEARALSHRVPQVHVLWNEPEDGAAAMALVCGNGTCSDPVTDPKALESAVKKLLGAR